MTRWLDVCCFLLYGGSSICTLGVRQHGFLLWIIFNRVRLTRPIPVTNIQHDVTFECLPIVEFHLTMTALRHAIYGVLFRFVNDVDFVRLYLPMSKCLVLTQCLFCGIVQATRRTCMLFGCRCFVQLAVIVVVGSASVQAPPVLVWRRRRDSLEGV